MPIPGDVASFASGVASGISLTLDGGDLQPAKPLEVQFKVPEAVGPVFVLSEDNTTGTGVAFLESVWDPEQSTVTATADHLSWIAPVKVDEEKFSDKVADWIEQSAGVNSAKPECFSANDELRFSAVRDQVVWPCAEEGADGVEWSLQSNSGLVWEVLTEPQAKYEPLTALSLAGIITIEMVHFLEPVLEGDTVVLPMETLQGAFEDGEDTPYRIALKVEPGLSQVTTLLFGLSMMFPSKWLDLAMKAECLVNVVKTATSAPSGESWRTIWSCVGEFLAGAAGNLIGILMTAPGLFATQMDGLTREITQTNAVEFTLGNRDSTQVDALPSGATWLHDLPQEIVPHDAEEVAALVPVGDRNVVFTNSSSVWVGCDGTTHVVIFYLDGKYSELSFGLGLQAHAPDGLTADFVMRTVSVEDSRFVLPQTYAVDVGAWTLERGAILERQTLNVDGVWSVALYAATEDECGSADIGYGALLDAYVK